MPAIKKATDTPSAAPTVAPKTTPEVAQAPEQDPYRRVRVRSKNTGLKHPGTVPATWLDGRFPDLIEVPSSRKDS